MGKGKDGALECCLVCGGVAACCIIVLVVLSLLGIGIAKIVMGAIHLHDCSIQHMIPIYLIVSGVVPLLFGGCGRNDEDGQRSFKPGDVCGLIGFIFQVSWLVCGSIWVYPNYGKVTSHEFVPCSGNVTSGCTHGNCNKPFITFAMAMVTLDWIFFLFGIGYATFIIYSICSSRSQ